LARWFDPSRGEVQDIGNYEAAGEEQSTSPFEEDALLMFGPPIEGWLDDDLIRIIVLVAGSLLVLVLLFLIIRQIKRVLARKSPKLPQKQKQVCRIISAHLCNHIEASPNRI
jgi:hypothetical protein